MRLSDLLDATVRDVNGEDVGRIHDVRMSRTGPVVGDFGAAYSIDGVLIGSVDIASRLGFDRRLLHSPAPLGALFRWMVRKTRYAAWEDIRSIEEGLVRLRISAAEIGSPAPLPD